MNPTQFAISSILILSASSAVWAQSHTVEVCSSRFQGPCGTATSPTPPTQDSPLSATVHDLLQPGGCFKGGDVLDLTADVTAPRPFEVVGTFDEQMCAAFGGNVDGNLKVEYEILGEPIVFSRTDQQAAPGETVDVIMWLEYRFIAHAMNPGNGNNGDLSFDFFMDALNSATGEPNIGQVFDFQGAFTIDTGWVMRGVATTVPLDTPITERIVATAGFVSEFDTCASCGGPHFMDVQGSMHMRLISQPFQFNGPGTYTADAPQLLIVDNTWPVSTTCPADIADTDGAGADGQVNLFDLLLLIDNWGTNGAGADISSEGGGDTVVDLFDLLAMLDVWGSC